MRNSDIGFDVSTCREHDHACRDGITQDAAPCYVMGSDVLPHDETNQ